MRWWHPSIRFVDVLTTDDRRAEVEHLRTSAARKSELDRTSEEGVDTLAKRGAFTGGHVVNPFTGQAIPVYVADYVLMRYGTGAIMAVPAEDDTGLGIRPGSRPPRGADHAASRRIRRRCVDG